MLKGLTEKEYNILKSIDFKHNRYYISDVRIKTKATVLIALRLDLRIKEYDTLLETWKYINSGE